MSDGKYRIPARVDFSGLRECELIRRLCAAEKALTYYANPKNWRDDDWGIPAVSEEYGNAGRKARTALRVVRGRRA